MTTVYEDMLAAFLPYLLIIIALLVIIIGLLIGLLKK